MTDNKKRFTGHDFPYERPKPPSTTTYISEVSMEDWRSPLTQIEEQIKWDKRKRLVINIICFIAGMALMYILCL